MKSNKVKLVVLRCKNSVLFPEGVQNRAYILLKSFWSNGEGYYRIMDESNGKVYEVPDVFFDACGLALNQANK